MTAIPRHGHEALKGICSRWHPGPGVTSSALRTPKPTTGSREVLSSGPCTLHIATAITLPGLPRSKSGGESPQSLSRHMSTSSSSANV
ncbi:hypothetical protein BN1723_001088 [Verticillium longisporum]|uniref:Uncharacterized protein n=1 Tax=Verticillium longisporum TaxID=100787 RepID=A0A0G4NH60_VERLO|nr:hypothetical protein HYQ46_003378 [Verticillium longisporum]CRK37338.1 hypothetical protein BN1708_001376 [Verticillium longisporum]CRK45745.1 hypothetical protein BN1723_001088 [Verticillium longisporum]